MKTLVMTAVLMTLIAGALIAPASMSTAEAATLGDDHRRVRLQGVIVEVNRHGIVLRVQRDNGDHRDVPIRIGDRTRIFLNGEPARHGDLQPRDRARVRGVRTRHGVKARTIRAVRRDG